MTGVLSADDGRRSPAEPGSADNTHMPLRTQEPADVLARSPLFANVEPELVSGAIASGHVRTLSAQAVVLNTGDANAALHIILGGGVSVRVPGTDTPHVRLGAGECVGELSLLDGRPVSADVVAEETTEVISIDRAIVWALVDASSEFARNLLRVLAGRIRHDDDVVSASSRRTKYFEEVAAIDGLTGIHNRRWLDETFSRQVERAVRAERALTLLLIDIDHFKRLNDERGHAAGDEALRQVSAALAAAVRPRDSLARYGGEEFAVLVPDVEGGQARQVAERLRETVAACALAGAGGTTLTISVGVAVTEAEDTLAWLLARADAALYRAKASGRNRTCI
jgi:diguanylate cyclase (GGDEF)-like protein